MAIDPSDPIIQHLQDQIELLKVHQHDGSTSLTLSPKWFQGFPIYSSVPTFKAAEGTIVLYKNSTTYKIYVMLGGGWRSVAVT